MEAQPLGAAVQRILAALDYLGQPLDAGSAAAVNAALGDTNELSAITAIQNALDPHCLAAINIDPDGRVKLRGGPAKPQLVEGGWTVFLVKVHNEAGVDAQLRARSPNAASTFDSPKDELRDRWMELALFETQPISKTLSGLAVEYRIVQLYSRDAGVREAKLLFDVGQGTQAAGFQNEVDIVFQCIPAQDVVLRVRDENDQPCAGAFEIRDEFGRVYPAQSKRAAPDFGFHPQVYRGDGDTLRLPPGRYAVKFTRGPEMLPILRTVDISPTVRQLTFKVERWVDPSLRGWFSGDHHIHAAGCAHYTKPSEGVHAPDMMLHCLGEDLKVGCNLTWGPCFDYQKQFFTGEDDAVSTCECRLPATRVPADGLIACSRACCAWNCAAVLRRPLPAALRHRGLGLRLPSIWPPVSVAAQGADLSRRRFHGPLANPLSQHTALGQGAGGSLRARPLWRGPRCQDLRAAELCHSTI